MGVIGAQGLFPDLQGPLVQGQGLVINSHILIKSRQIVEGVGSFRMLWSLDLFPDLQSLFAAKAMPGCKPPWLYTLLPGCGELEAVSGWSGPTVFCLIFKVLCSKGRA